MDTDNKFKDKKDFYSYLTNNVAAFRGNSKAIEDLDTQFAKRNIRLVVDESEFKITVQAQMNQSVETIEAWVTVSNPTPTNPSQPSSNPNPQQPLAQPGVPIPVATGTPDTGLRINFMKIL